jgi:hypothetical protein
MTGFFYVRLPDGGVPADPAYIGLRFGRPDKRSAIGQDAL